jgi:hypothetical protein
LILHPLTWTLPRRGEEYGVYGWTLDREEKMGRVQMIDLSVPVAATPPQSPLKVEIQCISYKEGTQIHGKSFGLNAEDFPEGSFSAVEIAKEQHRPKISE